MAGLAEPLSESIDFVNDEGGVRRSLRPEIRIDTYVDFAETHPKPASVASLKPRRLLFLDHSEEPHEEGARFILTSCRNRE
jgi:hypothetical protein